MITNVFLSVLKLIIGVIGKSGALIADGIHSFSDLATDLVAVVGNYLSKKPADEKHPYGHGKIEYVTSIVISVVILFLGLSIIYESTKKEVVIPSIMVAIVSLITILVKFILSRYIIKKGKEYQNNILLASGYESSTDVISSVVVFISILLMQLSPFFSPFKFSDMIASILVGILIIKIGFQVLQENLSNILEEQVMDSTYLDTLKKLILENNHIKQIDELRVLKYGFYYKLVAEVSIDANLSLLKAHQYVHEAEHRLKAFDSKLKYITIHVNPEQNYQLVKAKKKNFDQINQYRLETIITEEKPNKKEFKLLKKHLTETLKNHFDNYFMIVVDQKIIGTVGYYDTNEHILFIDEIFIEKPYRHCSIGSKILKGIKTNYPEKEIVLWVYKNNSIARTFYEQLGFQKINETNERIQMKWS